MRQSIIVLSVLAILCRCHWQGASAENCGEEKPSKSDATSATNSPRVHLYDGFEEKSLANFWRPGDHGSGRYVPGAVALSNKYARSGKQCVRITVNEEGDIEQTGDDGKQTERAELDSGKHPFVGREVWYGFSFLIPAGFPVVDNRLVIAQWKQGSVDGGPLVAQRFRNGRHYLTLRTAKSSWSDKQYSLPEISFWQWHDMTYHIVFSPDKNGRLEVWMNRKKVVSYQGPTTIQGGEVNIYNKFGLYRDRWKEPMTIFFDNYTLGDNSAAVDPARFDHKK
jgi:hypothetical protein